MNYINKNIYLPLLDSFYQQTKELYKCGYDQGPFIPYTMSHYTKSPIKIFYIGQDTLYWVSKQTMDECYQSGHLDDYLIKNINCVTVDKMMSWGNSPSSFWSFVEKLHLLLRTGKYYEDIFSITKDEKLILEEIGYSNINSIELPYTCIKRWEEWFNTEADIDKYNLLHGNGQKLTAIPTLIRAYKPDFIFVLTRSHIDFGDLVDDYELQKDVSTLEDGWCDLYLSRTQKPPILQTKHPSYYLRASTNQKEMAEYLAYFYHKYYLNSLSK